VRARQAKVQAAARAADLNINFPAMQVMPNTARAHRLLAAVRHTGPAEQQAVLMDHLFRAHFVEGRDIGDRMTLVALAQACGVDANVTQQAVADTRPIEGCTVQPQAGVPHFVFNRRGSLSGAHPPHVLLGAMRQAHDPLLTPEEAR
jgi:predicted DsbA family dithiol-disulfide isomerase